MIRWTAAVLICAAVPAFAQDDPIDLANEATAALSEAALLLSQADGAEDRIAALSETIEAYETGLTALRDGLRSAALRERAIRNAFEESSDALARTLGALQTFQTAPAATVLLHPDGPSAAARAAMLVGSVTPSMQAEASALRTQLDELSALRAVQANAVHTLETALDGAIIARTSLGQAIAQRQPLPAASETDTAILQALVNSTDTLQGFAALLATDRPVVDGSAFEAAQGSLPLPVSGTVISGFDQVSADGVRRPGLLLATLPGALVRSPWPGTLRYRGPFLDDGEVVILEPEAGYLIIISGLSETLGASGEIVDTGAPLGFTAGGTGTADQILIDTRQGGGQDRSETVYIELRRGETPVDPARWFDVSAE